MTFVVFSESKRIEKLRYMAGLAHLSARRFQRVGIQSAGIRKTRAASRRPVLPDS
jgi:hypothetical protein